MFPNSFPLSRLRIRNPLTLRPKACYTFSFLIILFATLRIRQVGLKQVIVCF